MLTLSSFKYRNIFKKNGGPIERMECGPFDLMGQSLNQAVAFLDHSICPKQKNADPNLMPDGAGTHKSPLVARFMAISEAMERWALRSARIESPSDFGFDSDKSSNGMAAFPGLFKYQAKQKAIGEAIERYCLINWWEGKLKHKVIAAPWRSVRAIEIENPFTAHSVVLLWTNCCNDYHYAYGFGSGKDFNNAVYRASIELERCKQIIIGFREEHRKITLENIQDAPDFILRRILYFAIEEGIADFQERLRKKDSSKASTPKVLFDGEIVGPWSEYATVWRTLYSPPSFDYIDERKLSYFWW